MNPIKNMFSMGNVTQQMVLQQMAQSNPQLANFLRGCGPNMSLEDICKYACQSSGQDYQQVMQQAKQMMKQFNRKN